MSDGIERSSAEGNGNAMMGAVNQHDRDGAVSAIRGFLGTRDWGRVSDVQAIGDFLEVRLTIDQDARRFAVRLAAPWSDRPQPWLFVPPIEAWDWASMLGHWLDEEILTGAATWAELTEQDGVFSFTAEPYGFRHRDQSEHARRLAAAPAGWHGPVPDSRWSAMIAGRPEATDLASLSRVRGEIGSEFWRQIRGLPPRFPDGNWYLVNPALPEPRSLGSWSDTEIRPDDRTTNFPTMPERRQNTLIEDTWRSVIRWALDRGASAVIAATKDRDKTTLRVLDFESIPVRHPLRRHAPRNALIYAGTDLEQTLGWLGQDPSISVLVCADDESIAMVSNASWWSILVRSDVAPTDLIAR